jgi:hypothetical protein
MDAVSKLEREHGLQCKLWQEGPRYWVAWAIRRGQVVATALGDTRRQALRVLRESLYQRARLQELADAGYRDRNTGELGPLQVHHRKRRSAGRDDSAENLAAVSPRTHEAQHRRGRLP